MAKKFNEDGVRIGDDGLPMTSARLRLHHLYNFCFIFMVVAFIAAVACIALSYFQGQQLTDWELVAYGGNQFNGHSVATMLRVEALYLLFATVICLFANMKGMSRMYDGAPLGPATLCLKIMGIVSAVFFVFALVYVPIVEPASLIMSIVAFLGLRWTKETELERKLGYLEDDKGKGKGKK